MILFSKNKAVLTYVLTCFLASCTSTTVDEFRQGETGIESDESVVILGRRQASDFETKSDFVECVGKGMSQGENAISVVPEREFIDAMFPWFEPRTAPLRATDLEQLLAEDVGAQKMNEFGIMKLSFVFTIQNKHVKLVKSLFFSRANFKQKMPLFVQQIQR